MVGSGRGAPIAPPTARPRRLRATASRRVRRSTGDRRRRRRSRDQPAGEAEFVSSAGSASSSGAASCGGLTVIVGRVYGGAGGVTRVGWHTRSVAGDRRIGDAGARPVDRRAVCPGLGRGAVRQALSTAATVSEHVLGQLGATDHQVGQVDVVVVVDERRPVEPGRVQPRGESDGGGGAVVPLVLPAAVHVDVGLAPHDGHGLGPGRPIGSSSPPRASATATASAGGRLRLTTRRMGAPGSRGGTRAAASSGTA